MIFNIAIAFLLSIAPCCAVKPTAFTMTSDVTVATVTYGIVPAFPTATAFSSTRTALKPREELKVVAPARPSCPSVAGYILQPIRSLFNAFSLSTKHNEHIVEAPAIEIVPASVPTPVTPVRAYSPVLVATTLPVPRTGFSSNDVGDNPKIVYSGKSRSEFLCLIAVVISITLLVTLLMLMGGETNTTEGCINEEVQDENCEVTLPSPAKGEEIVKVAEPVVDKAEVEASSMASLSPTSESDENVSRPKPQVQTFFVPRTKISSLAGRFDEDDEEDYDYRQDYSKHDDYCDSPDDPKEDDKDIPPQSSSGIPKCLNGILRYNTLAETLDESLLTGKLKTSNMLRFNDFKAPRRKRTETGLSDNGPQKYATCCEQYADEKTRKIIEESFQRTSKFDYKRFWKRASVDNWTDARSLEFFTFEGLQTKIGQLKAQPAVKEYNAVEPDWSETFACVAYLQEAEESLKDHFRYYESTGYLLRYAMGRVEVSREDMPWKKSELRKVNEPLIAFHKEHSGPIEALQKGYQALDFKALIDGGLEPQWWQLGQQLHHYSLRCLAKQAYELLTDSQTHRAEHMKQFEVTMIEYLTRVKLFKQQL